MLDDEEIVVFFFFSFFLLMSKRLLGKVISLPSMTLPTSRLQLKYV